MSRHERAWAVAWRATAALVVLTMVLSMLPAQDGTAGVLLYLVPVALAVGLTVVATRRIPRADRGPWVWVAASQVLFLVGELVSARYELSGSELWPTPAEVFYLAGQVAIVVGVLGINRRRLGEAHRGDLLDSAIIASSLGVLAVVFLVLPGLVDEEATAVARLVGAAYPIFDVVLVYMMVRMTLSSAGRAGAYWALLGAQLAMLVADLGWTTLELVTGTEADGYPWWANLLWQSGYLFLALAACTATGLATVRPRTVADTAGGLNERRLVVLTVASLAPSMILIVVNVRSGMENPGWLALGSILLGCLVAARIWDLLQQLRAQTAIVARMAAHDALTGLPNRRSWDEALARTRSSAGASGTARHHVVALLDLDRFKAFNDAHGHQAGDQLLQEAGAAWGDVLDGTGLLARWGGEEFAVLLPDRPLEPALDVLERLRAAVPGGQTCSVGAAVWDGAEPPDAVLSRADRALYAAKAAGRDRVVVADAREGAAGAVVASGAVVPGQRTEGVGERSR